MKRICRTCRWWQRVRAEEHETCNNVDSDMLSIETHDDYSCNQWEQKLEQDGDATWFIE